MIDTTFRLYTYIASRRNIKIKTKIDTSGILCVCTGRYNHPTFDNHRMALMLVDVLRAKGAISEATYSNIIKKSKGGFNYGS